MEKHGGGVEQALRMLDAFASVGAQCFDITHTDIDGNKRGFRSAQSLQQTCRSIPYLIESAAKRQNNVIVRPHGRLARLVQLDDLDSSGVQRIRDAAFLILATSAGNYQAWVAIAPDAGEDFARRLRRGRGADPPASGATRVAGTANFKRKYEPNFPIVAVAEAVPGRTVMSTELEALGLVAGAETAVRSPPPQYLGSLSRRGVKTWPSYTRCLEGAPPAHHGDRPDVSRADFTWCMTAISWGFGVEDTAARLMEESTKARENGDSYALRTAQRAAEAVERRHAHQR